MARLAKPVGLLMTLAALLLPALSASAEETTRQVTTVVKKGSVSAQPSKIQVTVSGKELLDALQTDLKPPQRLRFTVTSMGDSAILTPDALDGELTALLEKARTLLNEHVGKIEIVHKDWDKCVNKTMEKAAKRFRDAQERVRDAQARFRHYEVPLEIGGGFGGMGGYSVIRTTRGGPGELLGYAYADEDREHAAELERECHELASQYMRSKDEAKRAELTSKLTANLNELFDLKLRGFTAKITAIEGELERLRTQLDERKNNKELIVTVRFKELIGEHDHLRW